MEEDTVNSNEQLENLEESTEDSDLVYEKTQSSENSDSTIDEDSRQAPDDNELSGDPSDETSETITSTGNLIEEWGYLNKPNFLNSIKTTKLTNYLSSELKDSGHRNSTSLDQALGQELVLPKW